MSENIVFLLECIGTIAFAISGVLVAIESRLDVFGVVFIGCITAVGGGILRDVILGTTPPAIFDNTYIFLIALSTSILGFLTVYIKKDIYSKKGRIEYINNFFDAIGLGLFSVMGSEVALINGYGDNVLIVIVSGMVTGIGGGILRDALTNNIPFVLRKYVYAVASLTGTVGFYIIRISTESLIIASIVAVVVIVIIRLLATKYRWRLPRVEIDEEI